MGCCPSRPTNDDDDANSQDSRAATTTTQIPPGQPQINTASRTASQAVSSPSNSVNLQTRNRNTSVASSSANIRPNKPLRSPSPVLKCPIERTLSKIWTRSQLQREREEFFETRVAGDPNVWTALKVICDLLRNGDVKGAQAIMDTVGLTCPTGRIKSEKPRKTAGNDRRKGGVFDARGKSYDLPGWVIMDPMDIVEDDVNVDGDGEKVGDDDDDEDDDEEDEEGDGDNDENGQLKKAREEKRKERAEKDMIIIRVRMSDSGGDEQISMGKKQKVKVLIRKLQDRMNEQKGKTEDAAVSSFNNSEGKIKVMYLGKILSEDKTLIDQGWQEGHVVNALIRL